MHGSEPVSGTWQQNSLPDDYRWWLGSALALGAAPHGGADFGEIFRVLKRLRGAPGDDSAWFRAWTDLGDVTFTFAEAVAGQERDLTAASAYLRACNYYQTGERFLIPKTSVSMDVYRKSIVAFGRYAELVSTPHIERVEVAYEGTTLPAYFVSAIGREAPHPAVVFFDGLDISKELQYLRGVEQLAMRGVSCLVVDGPGNGESIRFNGLTLRSDYDVAGTACLDYLEKRQDVISERIGVMGISLGGYFAPRCAALDKRFRACVAWGAIWDYGATWAERAKSNFQTELSVPFQHLAWVIGGETMDDALSRTSAFRLEETVADLECPFLIVHGREDAQVAHADAVSLYEAAMATDKTLISYDALTGGNEHCQVDSPTRAANDIFDWLASRLLVGER